MSPFRCWALHYRPRCFQVPSWRWSPAAAMGFMPHQCWAQPPVLPAHVMSAPLRPICSLPFSFTISNPPRHWQHIAGTTSMRLRQASAPSRRYRRHAWQPDIAPGLDFFIRPSLLKIPLRKKYYEIIHYRHRSGLRRSGWFCSSRRDFVPDLLQGQGLRHLLQRQVLRVQTLQ